jgi:hypothetical protein
MFMFRQKSGRSILVLGRWRDGQLGRSSRWTSGFARIDWVEKTIASGCTNDRWHGGRSWGVLFPFLSRLVLETPWPLQHRGAESLGEGEHDHSGPIDSGFSSRIWCGWDNGGWLDGRLQLQVKITPAGL